MSEVTINGVLHDWECVTIVGPHGTFLGISDISWKSSQAKENRYGKGGVPRGVGRKNFEPEASVTLDRDEFDRLLGSLGGSPYRARFPLVITMSPPDAPSSITELSGCMINSVDEGAKQGDEKIEVKLDLRVGMIKRDGVAEYS